MITISIALPDIAEKLKTFMKGGEGYDSVLRTVATSALGAVKTRIHEQGKAADGSDIGQYNATNPLYVNPDNSPVKFQPAGKKEAVYSIGAHKQSGKAIRTTLTGNVSTKKEVKTSIKGNNHERKTKYFASYKDFRSEIHRPVDKVNLSLTGQQNNQFVVIATEDGYGLGWNNSEMPKRARGQEVKYGKPIYALTEDEQKKVTEVANAETHNVINKTFGNYKY